MIQRSVPDFGHPEHAAPRQLGAGTLFYATLLGPFSVYRGRVRVWLGHRRSVVELCRYLVAHAGRTVPQERLIELLWPEAEPAAALHRLHVTVSMLRQSLDGPRRRVSVVQHGPDSYSIPADRITTDCDIFEGYYRLGRGLMRSDATGAAAAFCAAVDVYGGDYLADEPYADWPFEYRAHFATRRLNVLTFLCDQAWRERDLVSLTDYAGQILAADGLRERAHRHLMRAYHSTGQRGCALRQYDICAGILQRELGEAPSRATRELYEALRGDAPLTEEEPLQL